MVPHLCGSGFRCVGVVDHDVVAVSNLHRQVMHRHKDANRVLKVDSAKRFVRMWVLCVHACMDAKFVMHR